MTTPAATRSPHPIARLAAPLFLLLAACPGGVDPSVIDGGESREAVVDVDFGLRVDLRLGHVPAGDARHADLDGDRVADLVETDPGGRALTIAFGSLDGSFTPARSLATAGVGGHLDLGDVDGDGMTDVVVACPSVAGGRPAIQVFRQGPGPREFARAPVTLFLRSDPTDVVCSPRPAAPPADPPADSPGDSPEDSGRAAGVEILVALGVEREVARIELSGEELVRTGGLESSFLGVAGSPLSVALVDLGNEGRSDLVVGEEHVPGAPDRVIRYPRTDTGFGDPVLVVTPVFAPRVDAAGDVDGDGTQDVAVVQRGDEGVLVLARDAGAGEDGAWRVARIDFGGATTSLFFRDLDGDGLAEAVGTVGGSIQVHPAAADLAWLEARHFHAGAMPRAIGTLLLPGDRLPSLLCGNARELVLLVATGALDFRAARGYDTGAPGASTVRTADLDDDGDVDVVTVARSQGSISFLEGNGDGTFATRVVLPGKPSRSDEPGHVAIVDIDCDGHLDVLASLVELDELRLYRGSGSVAGFRDPLPDDIFAVGVRPLGLATADLTGDTQPDVLVCNSGDGTIQTLLNVGAGRLEARPPLALGFAPRRPLLAELDGDGRVDAVVCVQDGAGGFRVVVLRGDGSGGFRPVETHQLGGSADWMAAGDLDEDGRTDVILGQRSSATGELVALLGRGSLRFEPRSIPFDAGPGAFALADLDHDAHLDLLVTTTGGELRFLLGAGAAGLPSDGRAPGRLSVPRRMEDLCYVDVDGDELEDLLLVGPETPFLWVARNTSLARP